MRILLKFSVATKKSADDFSSDVRDTGADFAGTSREAARFWQRENLGMGSELGGGELE